MERATTARHDVAGAGVGVAPRTAGRDGRRQRPLRPAVYVCSTAFGMTGSSPGNFASHSRRSARSRSTRVPYSSGE